MRNLSTRMAQVAKEQPWWPQLCAHACPQWPVPTFWGKIPLRYRAVLAMAQHVTCELCCLILLMSALAIGLTYVCVCQGYTCLLHRAWSAWSVWSGVEWCGVRGVRGVHGVHGVKGWPSTSAIWPRSKPTCNKSRSAGCFVLCFEARERSWQ